MSRAPRRGSGLADLALAVGCTAIAALLVQGNGGIWEHAGGGDLHVYFVPRFVETVAALRSGRVPLWNPLEFCGEPYFASPQVGVLYAPTLALFSLFDPRTAFQLLWVFHVFVLSWAMVAYLSAYVPSPWARAAGVAVALGGIPWAPGAGGGMDAPGFVGGTAWFAVLVLCWDRAVAAGGARGGTRWMGLLALAAAGQWFSGYPDFAMDAAVLLAILALCDGRLPPSRRLLVPAIGLAIGAAIAAVQLLGLAEAVRESVRVDRLPYYPGIRRGFAVNSAARLWQRVAALGPAAVAVAIASLLRPTRTTVAWAIALAWAVFAVTPPLSLLYLLPPFASSRLPVGWWHMACVLLGYLTAAGVGAFGVRRGRLAAYAVAALALLAVGDAARTLWRVPEALPQPAPDRDAVGRRARELRRLQDEAPPGTRLLGVRELAGTLEHGLRNAAGYDPLVPRRIDHLLDPLGVEMRRTRVRDLVAHPDVAALLGVGIVVAPEGNASVLEKAGFEPIGRLAGEVALHRPALPRAYVVHAVAPVADEAASLAWVLAHAGEARSIVAVEPGGDVADAGDDMAAPPPGAPADEATVVADEPERVAIRARAASAGLLVLNDTWHQGWRATVDGAPAPIARVNHAFRAVPISAGSHEVVFRYRPAWLVPGTAMSVAGLVAALALVAAPRRRAARASHSSQRGGGA
ncbi:MAG TPA: YfhO family protein [Candidatus Binatia bacterium]|nr:YfhO family protein [Candidatus Binatia bacterium]